MHYEDLGKQEETLLKAVLEVGLTMCEVLASAPMGVQVIQDLEWEGGEGEVRMIRHIQILQMAVILEVEVGHGV